MFISVCAFSLMDVIVKWSDEYPVGQVLFFRGFFGIIPLFFLIPRKRYLDFYKTNRGFLHFRRCAAGLIAIVAIFIALRKLPLATVVSISLAAPVFTTIMSIFLLSIAIGNIYTSVINFMNERDDGSIILSGANYFLFFSILMFTITILFIPFSKKYSKEKILLQG